jgi:hypothetical protein
MAVSQTSSLASVFGAKKLPEKRKAYSGGDDIIDYSPLAIDYSPLAGSLPG